MGFWGSLFKGAASLIPGVGPALSAGLDIAGKMGQGASAGRQAENVEALTRDQIGLRARDSHQDALLAAAQLAQRDKMDMAKLDMERRKFATDQASERAQQSIFGDVLANLRSGSFNRPEGVPTIRFSGGLSPDALGPNSRAAGQELSRQALLALMEGERFDPLQATEAEVLDEFRMTPQKQAGFWEKVLNGAGATGGILNAASAIAGRAPLSNERGELLSRRLATVAPPVVAARPVTPTLASRQLLAPSQAPRL